MRKEARLSQRRRRQQQSWPFCSAAKNSLSCQILCRPPQTAPAVLLATCSEMTEETAPLAQDRAQEKPAADRWPGCAPSRAAGGSSRLWAWPGRTGALPSARRPGPPCKARTHHSLWMLQPGCWRASQSTLMPGSPSVLSLRSSSVRHWLLLSTEKRPRQKLEVREPVTSLGWGGEGEKEDWLLRPAPVHREGLGLGRPAVPQGGPLGGPRGWTAGVDHRRLPPAACVGRPPRPLPTCPGPAALGHLPIRIQ